jgi:phosphoribosyl 1,2-cyclic phosphate phosphodiesterase
VRRSLTILGCGSSGGVPRVAQGWGACDPANPRNRRRRCSVLMEQGAGAEVTRVLVDTSPDLREQLLGAEVGALDAVLISHAHADHTHGIDDLRPIYIATRRRVDIFLDEATSRSMRRTFAYAFETPPGSLYAPMLQEHRLECGKASQIEGAGGALEVLPFHIVHGDIDALGFRFGGLAYTPDVSAIPDKAVPFLENLDVWIIDGLRYARHPTHFSVDEALEWIVRMRPRRAIITNLHTDLDYAQLQARLPEHVTPAYDGMRIEGF